MSREEEYVEAERRRQALLDELTNSGAVVLTLKNEDEVGKLSGLLPAWQISRYRRGLAMAGTGILQAMDCLTWRESPSTDLLVDAIIERFECSGRAERRNIITRLRTAFQGDEACKR
ncbi:MAG TPA: hypothetical protein VFE62_00225 [Gemmataceae bacterium]|nr:hypothetical protein [Gemmataceae bacterium]